MSPSLDGHMCRSVLVCFNWFVGFFFLTISTVEYPKSEIKRASLIPFGRVGRTDAELRKWAHIMALQQALNKATGPSATSGLWFGPRLGKRSVDAQQQTHKSPANGQKELY